MAFEKVVLIYGRRNCSELKVFLADPHLFLYLRHRLAFQLLSGFIIRVVRRSASILLKLPVLTPVVHVAVPRSVSFFVLRARGSLRVSCEVDLRDSFNCLVVHRGVATFIERPRAFTFVQEVSFNLRWHFLGLRFCFSGSTSALVARSLSEEIEATGVATIDSAQVRRLLSNLELELRARILQCFLCLASNHALGH